MKLITFKQIIFSALLVFVFFVFLLRLTSNSLSVSSQTG